MSPRLDPFSDLPTTRTRYRASSDATYPAYWGRPAYTYWGRPAYTYWGYPAYSYGGYPGYPTYWRSYPTYNGYVSWW